MGFDPDRAPSRDKLELEKCLPPPGVAVAGSGAVVGKGWASDREVEALASPGCERNQVGHVAPCGSWAEYRHQVQRTGCPSSLPTSSTELSTELSAFPVHQHDQGFIVFGVDSFHILD